MARKFLPDGRPNVTKQLAQEYFPLICRPCPSKRFVVFSNDRWENNPNNEGGRKFNAGTMEMLPLFHCVQGMLCAMIIYSL